VKTKEDEERESNRQQSHSLEREKEREKRGMLELSSVVIDSLRLHIEGGSSVYV
jgi:hypothetical protein